METLYYTRFKTKTCLGTLLLAASDQGLALLSFDSSSANFPPRRSPQWRSVNWVESEVHTRPYVQELTEYLDGMRKSFELPLDLRGTEFQKQCWAALLAIPYGQTKSYAEIARAVGKPKAFRAVGMANNRNPVAIVVPCHRVIASQGGLCGYGGGLSTKEWLLRLEGASWSS